MINFFTNHPEYANDITEEFRQAFYKEPINVTDKYMPPEADGDVSLSVALSEADGQRTATAVGQLKQSGVIADYKYVYTTKIEGEATPLERKRYQKRCAKIAAFRLMRNMFSINPPWGSLTGVRPTHLLRMLSDACGNAEARRIMVDDFDVFPEKYELCNEILGVQSKMPTPGGRDVGIYIGIPYCKTRCLYCSFPSGVRTAATNMRNYIDALKRDITLGAQTLKSTAHTVRSMYIGGGTPTVLTADELYEVISHALNTYGGFGIELTVEAGRPDTIDKEKLQVMKELGVTRISINPQTMNDDTLKLVGRSHSFGEIYTAFSLSRDLGFDNINMDVIAGLPGEDTEYMQRTLERICELSPDSLTVHTLAIKRSAPLALALKAYSVSLPDDDTVSSMTMLGGEYARRLNMHPYYLYRQKYMRGNLENIGYCLPNLECIYNVDMMEELTCIMAHGAGSMSKLIYNAAQRVERIPNPKDINVYIDKIERIAAEKQRLFELR